MFKSPAAVIREHLENNGIKQRFLAQKINMDEKILSSRLKETSLLQSDEIVSICLVLGLEPNDVLLQPENVGA
jgi:ribosome-binding protein aMBF1 (putative translation factor)